MPRTYELAEAKWPTKPATTPAASLSYCPGGAYLDEVDCYLVAGYDGGPLRDGPEPDRSGRCNRHSAGQPGGVTYGGQRQVDGAIVRLSTEGCHALKRVGDGKWMMVVAPADAELPPDEFARMAASITLRE